MCVVSHAHKISLLIGPYEVVHDVMSFHAFRSTKRNFRWFEKRVDKLSMSEYVLARARQRTVHYSAVVPNFSHTFYIPFFV